MGKINWSDINIADLLKVSIYGQYYQMRADSFKHCNGPAPIKKQQVYFSVCRGGYKKVGDICVKCPVGSFRGYNGPETECKFCPPRTKPSSSRTRCGMYKHHGKIDNTLRPAYFTVPLFSFPVRLLL